MDTKTLEILLDESQKRERKLLDVLRQNGFVECDIRACNCGSWHHQHGLPERFAEIKELLSSAGVLNNNTGNLPSEAIKLLIMQRDEAEKLNNKMFVIWGEPLRGEQ